MPPVINALGTDTHTHTHAHTHIHTRKHTDVHRQKQLQETMHAPGLIYTLYSSDFHSRAYSKLYPNT